MKILLLMDNRGDRNWGSQATTQALVGLLQERFPQATIEGVSRSAVDPGKFWRKRTESWAPAAMARDYGGLLDPFALNLLTRSWAAKFEDADLVVLNGEGTLHPQRQTRRWLPALDFLESRFRKRLWIVNTTIECKGSPEAWQFERVLKWAERVVVRDENSHRELNLPTTLAADCAYLTTVTPFSAPVRGDYAVLTGTASMRHWPAETFLSAVETLRAEGLEVVYTASDRLDFNLPARMGIELPTITDQDAGPRELMGLQAGAQILVGGRYHPTILAALSGTPFVSLTSNTFKTQALMKALETEELLAGIGECDRIPGLIRSVLHRRAEWSRRVSEAAARQARLARLNVFEESR